MKSNLRISALLFLTLGFLAACRGGNATPGPLVFNPPPWQDGEVHTFRLTDVDGKPAGVATFTFTAGVDDKGEPGWTVERRVDAQGAVETVTTKVGGKGFRPTASLLERTGVDGSTETVDAAYKGAEVLMTLTSRDDVTSLQRVEVPSDVRDSATLPMLVRALPLARNYATRINSFVPIMGILDMVQVRVTGEAEVTAPAGTYRTWVVELALPDVTSTAWVAQEAPFPLVKYYDGRNKGTYELENFQP
jgi:hypothetical protein